MISQGAVLSALFVLLVLVGEYIPALSVIAHFVWPIPLVVMVLRHGGRAGLLMFAASMALLGAILGPSLGLAAAGASGLLGVAMGLCLARRFHPVLTLGVSAVAVALGTVLQFVLLALLMDANIVAELVTLISQSYTQAADITAKLGGAPGQVQMLRDLAAAMPGLMIQLIPFMLVGGALSAAFFHYITAEQVLRRLGIKVQPFPSFGCWQFPQEFILGYLAATGLLYAHQRFAWPDAEAAGLNLYAATTWLFSLQALSVAVHFSKRTQYRLFLYAMLIMFLPTLLQFAWMIGMLDSIFDWRRLRVPAAAS